MIEIFIGVGILCMVLMSGYFIGKTVTSLKYATQIDKLHKIIDDREERIHSLYEKLRKGKIL